MTHSPAHEARIHVLSEGVVASYINEISAGPILGRRLQPRRSRRPEPRHEIQMRADQRRDRARSRRTSRQAGRGGSRPAAEVPSLST